MGTHRLDRLATVAGRRSTMKAQSTQARLVASTAEYSRPQSSPGAQSMARDGISAAASARNSVPISICQAVNASGVGWCRWNMRLDSTVPSAQEQPPVIASTVLPDDEVPSRYMLIIDRVAGVQTLVLAGTNSSFQWQFNLDLAKLYEPSLSAAVHRGFLTATSVVFNDVLPRLEPAYPVDVVGYSLGGAIACILSEYLLLDGFELRRVVTFGQPRLTDTAGVSTFSQLPLLRFVNEGDPIPRLAVGDSPHFGSVVVLFQGPYYGYVASADARLQEAVPTITFEDEFLNDIQNHLSEAYRARLRTKLEEAVLLRFP